MLSYFTLNVKRNQIDTWDETARHRGANLFQNASDEYAVASNTYGLVLDSKGRALAAVNSSVNSFKRTKTKKKKRDSNTVFPDVLVVSRTTINGVDLAASGHDGSFRLIGSFVRSHLGIKSVGISAAAQLMANTDTLHAALAYSVYAREQR